MATLLAALWIVLSPRKLGTFHEERNFALSSSWTAPDPFPTPIQFLITAHLSAQSYSHWSCTVPCKRHWCIDNVMRRGLDAVNRPCLCCRLWCGRHDFPERLAAGDLPTHRRTTVVRRRHGPTCQKRMSCGKHCNFVVVSNGAILACHPPILCPVGWYHITYPNPKLSWKSSGPESWSVIWLADDPNHVQKNLILWQWKKKLCVPSLTPGRWSRTTRKHKRNWWMSAELDFNVKNNSDIKENLQGKKIFFEVFSRLLASTVFFPFCRSCWKRTWMKTTSCRLLNLSTSSPKLLILWSTYDFCWRNCQNLRCKDPLFWTRATQRYQHDGDCKTLVLGRAHLRPVWRFRLAYHSNDAPCISTASCSDSNVSFANDTLN